MPIYEYRCKACGRIVEVLQKLRDKPLKRCEACEGSMERVVSRTAFQLKGGGWSSSGYHKDAPPSGPTSPSDSAGESTTKTEATGGDASAKGKKPGACGPGCGCH